MDGQVWAASNRLTPYETVFRIVRRHESDEGWRVIWRFRSASQWRADESVVWDTAWAPGSGTAMTRVE